MKFDEQMKARGFERGYVGHPKTGKSAWVVFDGRLEANSPIPISVFNHCSWSCTDMWYKEYGSPYGKLTITLAPEPFIEMESPREAMQRKGWEYGQFPFDAHSIEDEAIYDVVWASRILEQKYCVQRSGVHLKTLYGAYYFRLSKAPLFKAPKPKPKSKPMLEDICVENEIYVVERTNGETLAVRYLPTATGLRFFDSAMNMIINVKTVYELSGFNLKKLWSAA